MTAKKIDVNKLKANLAGFRTSKSKSTTPRQNVFWTPDIGEHTVYLLPWTDQEMEEPFKFVWLYYNLGGAMTEDGRLLKKAPKDEKVRYVKAPLTLRQYGKTDPVQEMIDSLHESGDESDKELAKKLYATQVAMVPIIVKGEEELGVRIWKITSKTAYEQLTNHYCKFEEIGFLNDPQNARWVNITVLEEPGKPFPLNKKISQVTPSFKNSPLSEDSEEITKWVENIPDIDEAMKWQKHDYDSLSKLLEAWSKGGLPVDSSGTEKTADPEPKKASGKKKSAEKAMSKAEAMAEVMSINDDDDDDDDDE